MYLTVGYFNSIQRLGDTCYTLDSNLRIVNGERNIYKNTFSTQHYSKPVIHIKLYVSMFLKRLSELVTCRAYAYLFSAGVSEVGYRFVSNSQKVNYKIVCFIFLCYFATILRLALIYCYSIEERF